MFTSIISKISSFVLVLTLAIIYGYAQIELEKRSDLI